jgi:hypothetical protein
MRRADWLKRLWQTLEASNSLPFAFGSHDCVLLVARCLDSFLVDSAWVATVRGLYHDKRSAVRLLMRTGLDELVSAHLGPPAPRNWARCGDVAEVDLRSGPALGVCVGPKIALAASPAGIEYLPLHQARNVWRVD